MKIAIDGPAGAGKSTIAKRIAQQLGFLYIDTGAMYRALTWKAMQEGIPVEEEHSLVALAASTLIHFEQSSPVQRVLCDQQDVTEAIRSPEVSALVSKIASKSEVRSIMVKKQQDMAFKDDVVMDGRDIGEQVLPDADFKFFITASLEERARRRTLEMRTQGYSLDETKIINDMQMRDQMDTVREMGALKILPDSIVIDTSEMSIEQVLGKMLSIIRGGKNVI